MAYDDEDFLVTPEWAERILREHQSAWHTARGIVPEKMKSLEKDMWQADWAKKTPVKFDRNGKLIDGVHRLAMARDKGLSFWVNKRTYR